MKPLKKRIKANLNMRKRKFSANTSKNNRYKSKEIDVDTKASNATTPPDTLVKPNGYAILDTLIIISYTNLTDSMMVKQKQIIQEFINRVGIRKITEVTLTDFYTNGESKQQDPHSIKNDIDIYLHKMGVSDHRIFWYKNKFIKNTSVANKHSNLMKLEIRIH